MGADSVLYEPGDGVQTAKIDNKEGETQREGGAMCGEDFRDAVVSHERSFLQEQFPGSRLRKCSASCTGLGCFI